MLTPAELGDMMLGAAKREEQRWEREAWTVAHLMNISGKVLNQPITADSLLGRKNKHEIIDPELKFDELWRRVEMLRAKEKAELDGD